MSQNKSNQTNTALPNFTDMLSWDKIRLRVQGNHFVISPVRRKRVAQPTVRQLETQQRFKDAATYAKQMIKDPEKLAEVPTRMRKVGKAYRYFLTEYMKSVKGKETAKAKLVPELPLTQAPSDSRPKKVKPVTMKGGKRSKKR